jgi:hypothetical protein
MESPFLNQALLLQPPVQDAEVRAAAVTAESPFLHSAAESFLPQDAAEAEELEVEGLESYGAGQAPGSEEGPAADQEDESSAFEALGDEEHDSSYEALQGKEEDYSPSDAIDGEGGGEEGEGEDEERGSPSDESMEFHEEHESPSDEALEADEEYDALEAAEPYAARSDEAVEAEEEGESWLAETREVDELGAGGAEDLVASGEIDPELVDELEQPEHDPAHETPSLEMFVPAVSQADLRARIDEYLDLANATYTLPDGGGTVRARPQFRFAKSGHTEEAISRVSGILGKAFEKAHPRAIHMAAYGRAKPSELTSITQGLIDAGEFKKMKDANAGATNEELVRRIQREFRMGIDCAGYVQLAFIHAYRGSDDDSPSIRRSLGLHEKRGWEKLAALPKKHFTKVNVTDARTGDLFVLRPRAGATDNAWHTVLIVERKVSDTVHTFVCDASWGTDLYGVAAGGVARRELKHDTSTGDWWDVHPLTGVDAHRNRVGPYNEHRIHGMFRPNEKK